MYTCMYLCMYSMYKIYQSLNFSVSVSLIVSCYCTLLGCEGRPPPGLPAPLG